MFNATLDEWQRQVIHLGHAWRCYNQKVDDEGECQEPMTLETTINDLIEQNTKLGRERAAAVNHFTCIMALLLRSSDGRRSCRNSGATPHRPGITCPSSTGTLHEFNNHCCSRRRSWRITATTSSTLRKATTRRSRSATNASLL